MGPTTSSLATMLALFGTSYSHMIMKTPTPYGLSAGLNNSPLTSNNFPCQVSSDPATFYSTSGIDNTMAVGEDQTLSFTGSAVHGGGSCQLALTTDMQPSASSSWQVILSIEGGCPSTDGSGPSTYKYQIPSSIAPGKYSMAWTWISKLAGQPEYYMNCAPITVTGGTSKRSDNETFEDLAIRDALPQLFVANLAGINDCKAGPSVDVVYPDPGPNVQKPGASPSYSSVTASGCTPKVAAGAATTAAGSGATTAAATTPTAVQTSVAQSSQAASSPASAAGGSSTPGGVFATVGASSSAAGGGGAATQSASGFVTTTKAAGSATGVATGTGTGVATGTASAPSATGTGTSTGGSGSGMSGACTTEGEFNCDGKSYQQCASGAWTAMQALPAGTSCTVGQSTGLWAREQPMPRPNRFSLRRWLS